jgi:hypothetical protein
MLLCDAWFDVVTATPGGRTEAVLEAALAELPLALIFWLIVYDVERFRQETILRYAGAVRRMRGSES